MKRGCIIPFSREFAKTRSVSLMVSDLLIHVLPPGSYEIEENNSAFDPWQRDEVWVKVRTQDVGAAWLPDVPEGCVYPQIRFDELVEAIGKAVL